MKRFSRFAWFVLAFNVAVVLWGAVVRATVSGAGCGQHWPRCNGEVLPSFEDRRTIIEYSHRLTSGVALLLVVALAVWAWRLRRAAINEQAAIVSRFANASLVLMIGEALLGAGLVLLRLVELDASARRAVSMSLHLVNTFVLLSAITCTAACATWPLTPRWRAHPARSLVIKSTLALILVGITGALAALGDTLFPAASLAAGLAADADETAHALLRLRMLHPLVAVFGAVVLALAASRFSDHIAPEVDPDASVDNPHSRGFAGVSKVFLVALFAQLTMGALNLVLLVPLWAQLVHLLLADFVVISFALNALMALSAGTKVGNEAAAPPVRPSEAATLEKPTSA